MLNMISLSPNQMEEVNYANLKNKASPKAWIPLSNLIFVPHNEKEYDHLVNLLDNLIDEVW